MAGLRLHLSMLHPERHRSQRRTRGRSQWLVHRGGDLRCDRGIGGSTDEMPGDCGLAVGGGKGHRQQDHMLFHVVLFGGLFLTKRDGLSSQVVLQAMRTQRTETDPTQFQCARLLAVK